MSDFVVIAEARADQGKGASRRLRRLALQTLMWYFFDSDK